MTTSASKDSNTEASNQTAPDLDGIVDAGQRSLFSFAHIHSRLLRNALELNAELLEFTRARVREDIRTNDALTRCNDVREAAEVVNAFYKTAFEEYSAEVSKLINLTSEVAQHSIEDIQSEVAQKPEPASTT